MSAARTIDDESVAFASARIAMSLTAFRRHDEDSVLRSIKLYESALAAFQKTGNKLSQYMVHASLCKTRRHAIFADDSENCEHIILHAKQALHLSENVEDISNEEIADLYGCIAYAYAIRRFGDPYQNVRIGSLVFRNAITNDPSFIKREPFSVLIWIRKLLDNDYIIPKIENWVDHSFAYLDSLEGEKVPDDIVNKLFMAPINWVEDIYEQAFQEIKKHKDYEAWYSAIQIKSDLGKKTDSGFVSNNTSDEYKVLLDELIPNAYPSLWANIKIKLIDAQYHFAEQETIKSCLKEYELIGKTVELDKHIDILFEITLRIAHCSFRLGQLDKAYEFAVKTMAPVIQIFQTNAAWDERIFPNDNNWLMSLPVIAALSGHIREALLYFDCIYLRRIAYTLEDLLTIDQQVNRLDLFSAYSYYLQARRLFDHIEEEKGVGTLNKLEAIRKQLVKLRDSRGISTRVKFYQKLEDFLHRNDSWIFIPMVTLEETCFILIPPNASLVDIKVRHVEDISLDSIAKILVNSQDSGWAKAIYEMLEDLDSTQAVFENMEEYLWDSYGSWLYEEIYSKDKETVPKLCIIATGGLSIFPFAMAARSDGFTLLDLAEISYAPSLFAFYAITERLNNTEGYGFGLGYIDGGQRGIEGGNVEYSLISNHLGNYHLDVLRSESDFQNIQSTLRDKTHWHIDAHGKFEWSIATGSSLQIGDKQLWGGILVGLEASQLVRLVTLSACEAGLTDNIMEMSDPKGLPYSFLEVGSLGTIGAMWRQSEEASALLMGRFYYYYRDNQKLSPAAALRYAQLWLRNATNSEIIEYLENTLITSDLESPPVKDLLKILYESSSTAQPFANPVFWAGYYLLGQ